MKNLISKNVFEIRTNSAFEKVIENCKTIKRKGQDGTWISHAMQTAYIRLHEEGIAHSVEAWQSGKLVGGLYGLVINNIFCGESMFSKVSNASKAALIWLCRNGKYKMIDCQIPTGHLLSLGAVMIKREDYMKILQNKKI
jgi:leucyl/phenylalanyl-tRNA--protein transferase